MAYPYLQQQDWQREGMSDTIRAAWKVFSKEIYKTRDDNDLESLTPQAQKEWLKVLTENEWDPGAWMMTEKDKAQVFALLGWNPDELAHAAHETPAFSVNLRANDVRRSGEFSVRQARPIVQPQPKYAQPPHFQYMLFLPADVQRNFERTANVDNEEEEYETSYTDMDGDKEEEGNANEEEEEEEEDDDEEESNDADEVSSGDVDEEKGDQNDKPIVRILSGPDIFPIILIEPFLEKGAFDFLKSISPKLTKFARKSADRRLTDCHREAAHVMHKLTKRWLTELQNKRRDRELILSIKGYCEKSRDEWREEVGKKLEKLRQKHQHKLQRRGDTTPTPRWHRSGVKRDGEGPEDSQQQQWESTNTLHSPSPSGTKQERKGHIPGNIYERLEMVVREQIEHDKSRAESLRLPLQTLCDTNTSTHSISPPVRVPVVHG
ncbi:uncharacterized protein LACBIDRAFT_329416 [Laccaria bicolor S238N-H82]|uniref:Predicted protein n=1 Tax=Laccaria bicolor (strain S238N-H82 / ATCC MYA-4686) TaxID=486041 RepID=B0DHY3_LACBS|nr:uncharacterized protein LACBIDRAFT_329416 [Laccaria bicolor S238N-H82]EDR05810.1 predicted protein [Laccaria bicolor S238N-H82]|eukprot:XP_001883486.1 predicted protein [Laccaria bicolor S238N-H82]